MERKIGEIFEYNGKWYQCVKSPDGSCKHCDMNFGGKCPIPIKECVASARSDLSYVIFKKLEKVGEPYTHNSRIVQKYRIRTIPVIMLNEPYMYFNAINNTIEIEIKQTKENIEEKRLNSHMMKVIDEVTQKIGEEIGRQIEENINKQRMKPFNLEAAKAGKPVCTRDGRKARIICFDRSGTDYPILSLIKENDNENVYHYDIEGKSSIHPKLDLMMLPEKKEGWINIYNADTTFYYVDGRVFETKDGAVQKAKEEVEKEQREKNEYIDTIRVEWEE